MLRITVHEHLEFLTFQLEGKLAGAWVREVDECWQRTLAGRRGMAVRLDLAGVTFIDTAGKDLLTVMHRRGAEFVAADCLTKAIAAEIAEAPVSEFGARSAKAKARRNGTEAQHAD